MNQLLQSLTVGAGFGLGTVKRVHVIGVFRRDSGFEPCVIRSYVLLHVEGITLWKISYTQKMWPYRVFRAGEFKFCIYLMIRSFINMEIRVSPASVYAEIFDSQSE